MLWNYRPESVAYVGPLPPDKLDDRAAERCAERSGRDRRSSPCARACFSVGARLRVTLLVLAVARARSGAAHVRGNPVGIRDCPAAVSRNERRERALAL